MSSRRRFIFALSILLLLAFLGSLGALIGSRLLPAHNGEIGTSQPQTTVADSAVSTLKIQTQWRKAMIVGQSDDITIDLLPPSLVLATPGAEHTATISEATPVGTPGVPVNTAFGPGYETFAVGDLEAPEFAITPAATQTQALNQPDVQFLWTVSPKSAGPQVIYVTITGQWRPTDGGEVIERTLGEVRLDIQVQNPPPAAPQTGLDPGIVAAIIGAAATVVAALIGALVVWMQVSKDKKKKQKAKPTHSAAHQPEKPARTQEPPPPL